MRRAPIEDPVQALESARETGDPLCILIAETRWLTLKYTREEHANRAQMGFQAQLAAEHPGLKSFPHAFSRIYQYWESRRLPRKVLQTFLRLLIEREYADYDETLPVEEDDRGRERVLYTTYDLYRIWCYQCGFKTFQDASETVGKKIRLNANRLWNRRGVMVPSYSEVRDLAVALNRDPQEAQEIWERDKQQQLKARGISPAYARFLTLIESRRVSPITFEKLKEEFGIPSTLAMDIKTCKPVTFESIEEIAVTVLDRKELVAMKTEWVNETDALKREKFTDAFVRIRNESSITNSDLAEALNISQKRRPSHIIRRTYEDLSLSAKAPAGALVDMIARPNVSFTIEQRRTKERQYLEKLFFLDRADIHRRKGSALGDSELRLAREYWGVDAKLLEGIGGLSRAKILLVEEGAKVVSKKIMKALLQRTEAIGQQRADAAHEHFDVLAEERERKSKLNPRCMAEFMSALVQRVGSYEQILKLNTSDTENDVLCTIGLAKFKTIGIGKGKQVPRWPILKKIIANCGADVLPEFERDWFIQYPLRLKTRRGVPIRTPLARGIMTAVGYHKSTMKEVQNVLEMSSSTVNHFLYDLEDGSFPEWSCLSRVLSAVEMTTEDPIYRFLKLLWENRGDVRPSLLDWRKEMRDRKLDPKEYEYKLGLRPEELKIKK